MQTIEQKITQTFYREIDKIQAAVLNLLSTHSLSENLFSMENAI